ncbi:hypothetical protein ARMGADRAFT_1065842 [Armillaria gallica]|uniref:Uncharacterized protein n=1 Tax=Armillaria gallica TaxID=47427 RepID=A0A2H3D193_ARMGA|nr:hypothetical protein ARMGADRAFT_1065842 [Armillaria gallica]
MKSTPHPRGLLRFYEDEHVTHDGRAWRIIDATRLSDGYKVVLKAFPALRRYSRNHTIPILDAVSLPRLKNLALIVMLMFHSFLSPSFHCRIEFVERLRELLGVECIGYHFGFDVSQDGIEWKFPTERRYVAGAVDYYYINFQFAQCFPEGHDKAIISGIVGHPFKADVYQLCATVISEFGVISACFLSNLSSLQTHSGLNNFKPLLPEYGCCRSASKRPTASDALAQLDAIVSRSSAVSMTWRIWSN